MEKTIICVATPLYAPDIGGPATHVALLEQELPRDTYELRVVAFASVRALPKVLRHIVYFFNVLNAARGAQFVYALDGVSVGLPALMAAKLLGKKFLLRVGGDYAWEQGTQRFGVDETLDEFVAHRPRSYAVRALQGVQSFVACRAVCVVAPSEYLARIVQTWGVEKHRIHVIYSQPELGPALSKSEARKRLRLHEDEEIIFSAGRLVPWKGFTGLIDAVALVRRERRVRLYIAGSGPQEESLKAYIDSVNAGDYTQLLDQLQKEQIELWLAAADAFVLNTRYEGLSHMVLEAFNANTPVVTTPVGGNVELVEDGTTGLLVAPDDTLGLARAILKLLTQRAFAARLAAGAYQSLSHFNKDIALARLQSLFASVTV
jgi:glycosyltransferase involved in cell wall biosynthesis